MSSIKKQSVAKGMRWAARIIGLPVTFGAFYLLWLGVGEAVNEFLRGEGFDYQEFLWDLFLHLSIAVAAAGYIISWWKVRLGGALLVSAFFMTIAVGILLAGGPIVENVMDHAGFFSPFLVTGVLFLIAWWLSRKAIS